MISTPPTPFPAGSGHNEAALVAALHRLAAHALGGPVAALERLTGGASQELWAITIRGDTAPGFVLRRSPESELQALFGTASSRDEAAVIQAAERYGVPVAAVVHVLEPANGLGEGFISRWAAGEARGRRIVDSADFAAVRQTLAAECGRILAAIHRVALTELPALPRQTPAQAIHQLEAQLRALDIAKPVFEAALVWLRRNCPEPSSPQLVHGDFRTGNFLLQPSGISAVLDWEGCFLGDGAADLGWLCMPVWRFGHLDREVGGFGHYRDLLAAYAAASGRPVDPARIRFWEVHGILRWGLTCLAMARAFDNGERGVERGAIGRRAIEAELEIVHFLRHESTLVSGA